MNNNAVHPTSEDGAESLKITLKQVLQEAIDEGLNLKWIYKRIKQAGNAKKDPYVYEDPKTKEKTVKRFPDHHIRLKATEQLAKTIGISSEKIEIDDSSATKEFMQVVLDEIGKIDPKSKQRIIERLKEAGTI